MGLVVWATLTPRTTTLPTQDSRPSPDEDLTPPGPPTHQSSAEGNLPEPDALPSPLTPPMPPVQAQSVPPKPTEPKDSHRSVQAYDCARVTEMQAVQLPPPGECPKETVTVTDTLNVTYLVLQKVNFIPVYAKRCQGMESRLPAYCGDHDHQTLLLDYWRVNERDRMAPSDCRWIWTEGKVSLGGNDYAIKPNTTFQKQWNAVGENFYTSTHIDCEGGKAKVPTAEKPTRTMTYVVDGHYTTITTNLEELALNEQDRLTTVRDRLRLPCTFNAGYCQVSSGTYVWDDLTEDQKCRLYQARRTSGQLPTDGDGVRTFIATDGTAMRFTVGNPVFKCGRQVWETEHERLFLTRDLDEPLFQRRVPAAERSTLMYANVQDAYVEGTMAEKIEEIIATVKMESCRM